jgi:hypothetical protein
VESQLEEFEARDDDDAYDEDESEGEYDEDENEGEYDEDEDESEGEYDDKDENPGRFCVRAMVGGVWGGSTDTVGTLMEVA